MKRQLATDASEVMPSMARLWRWMAAAAVKAKTTATASTAREVPRMWRMRRFQKRPRRMG